MIKNHQILHQVPIDNQQYANMEACFITFILTFSQIWLNTLIYMMTTQATLQIQIFYLKKKKNH